MIACALAHAEPMTRERIPPEQMTPARAPRSDDRQQRMLTIDHRTGRLEDRTVGDLPRLVRPGDVVVLNDAATLPASLLGHVGGEPIELRLAGESPDGTFTAVLFGEGDFRADTDLRPPPPRVEPGDTLTLGPLRAEVTRLDAQSPRLLEVRFDAVGADFFRKLYRHGRPIQYRYVPEPVELAAVQTGYASRPWSVELPSAGRPLRPGLLGELRAAGAQVVTLTHAAGLSATGDHQLDRRLPLPERFDIPAPTVLAIAEAERVIAVGTSVVRALEGSAKNHGAVTPGVDVTDLRIGPDTRLEVVDALLTGAHDPSSSHYALLRAFASRSVLRRAVHHSVRHGYLAHEHGDSWWIC